MFPENQIYCVMDYETFSCAELKKVGAHEYARHSSTEILCAAWRVGTREQLRKAQTRVWAPRLNGGSVSGNASAQELFRLMKNPGVQLVAHNAAFEQVVTEHVFFKKYIGALSPVPLKPERWVCTASLAAALALPRSLEGATEVLRLSSQKDKEGRRLILKWSKPRKPTKRNPKTRQDSPPEFERLLQYCASDIAATVELFLACPPLSADERRVWILDQEINRRGFFVDRPLVKTVLGMMAEELDHLNEETRLLCGGLFSSTNQVAEVLGWLSRKFNIELPDLKKKTVEDELKKSEIPKRARRMLGLRLACSKTSTAKYQAMSERSASCSRVFDGHLYWAASTGRWGGSGVQPQNFPRGTIKHTAQAAEILREGDLELVRLIYGNPMEVFSSCLRSMIRAPWGRVLDIADYASIEARVLFWLAEHEQGLNAFRQGKDLYTAQAAEIFSVPESRIQKGSFERSVGKSAILGCGYSMGAKKFAESCSAQGIPVDQALAERAVRAYREAHAPVVQLWDLIGRAAMSAVQKPGTVFSMRRTRWYTAQGFLWCVLPSGRKLAYHRPRIEHHATPWGDKRPVLLHGGTKTLSRQWSASIKTYGGKLVENVVQAIARDILAAALLRINSHGAWKIVLSVHDEIVAERKADRFSNVSIETFCQLMAEVPSWAEGCPIAVEGFSDTVYRK